MDIMLAHFDTKLLNPAIISTHLIHI